MTCSRTFPTTCRPAAARLASRGATIGRCLVGALLLAGGPVGLAQPQRPDAADDRHLIEQTAAERQPVRIEQVSAARSAPEAALASDEARARADVAIANARLELVLARRALRAEQCGDAVAHAHAALAKLSALAAGGAAEELRLQAEGVLARCERGEAWPPEHLPVSPPERTATSSQRDWAHLPDSAVISKPRIRAHDDRRLSYQGGLREMVRSDESRRLVAGEQARLSAEGEIEYPVDWPERTARRRAHADGLLARSDSWVDEAGREWYVGIYDVRDLTYVPPNFAAPPIFDAYAMSQRVANLAALRERSQIFGGYAEDLAAGLPLLHLMGGLDDYAPSGPRYSLERQAEIVEMIRALAERDPQAQVISQPPLD